jgi:hypothetical protein
MVDKVVYTEEDIAEIHRILDFFVVAQAKYHFFKYFNKPTTISLIGIQVGLKGIMCETLFRHTILELYAIFFDIDPDSIAHVISKFIKNTRIEFKATGNEQLKQLLKNITETKKTLNIYRNNVLAHKSSITKLSKPENQVRVTSEDFDKLLNVSEKIVITMLKEIEPTTSYCTNIFPGNPDKIIQHFFKILAIEPKKENH